MKRFLALCLSIVMILALATATASAAPASDVITLRASHSCADTHPYHLGLLKFAELVDEKTDGAVKIPLRAAR